MKKHISTRSGQAGSNFVSDNGKIVDYQDNYKKIGDLPFTMYFDFETTTGMVVFFDAKMYVVSYCIVVAFHPDLNLPRLFIYRSYDQTINQITSLEHFDIVQQNFFEDKQIFNSKTLSQLKDATLSVINRENTTALTEMFNTELKFTADCLKFWFNKYRKILEISPEQKTNFYDNAPKNDCCLCDFPLQSRAENGWFQHVCKVEYLFLENIYTAKEMYQMGIDDFDVYFEKVKKVLDNVDEFCASIETENRLSIARGETNNEIKEIVEKIKKTNTGKNKKEEVSKEKTIGYLHKNSIKFLPNEKTLSDFPLSARFLQNLIFIHKNEFAVHHSHVTDKIVGYAHEFCNLQTRENYYTIPVLAHNQFRFDFFLLLKGLRAGVWETTEISIGGKNPTNVNFAIVQNPVRFIDTVKYYQQSLVSLAASMTDIEKENV